MHPSRITCAILMALYAVALGLRVIPRYDAVFAGDWVRFAEADPWYHMRLVENLLHSFPNLITFDPFTFFPHGQDVWFAPFYDLLLGTVTWILGAGSPSPHLIEVVGAWFPAVLGALTIVPVYLLGRELFGRLAGLLAAALIAIIPGEFLTRSVLGFSDHHVAEILFSTTAILFLVLSLRTARERGITFGHVRRRGRLEMARPLIFALLAGTFLGVYLLSWVGGLVFVGIIGLYAIIEYPVNHFRGKTSDHLSIVLVSVFLVALIILSPFGYVAYHDLSMILLSLGIVASGLCGGLSALMMRRRLRPIYYVGALSGLAIAGALAVYLLAPSQGDSMLAPIRGVFAPGPAWRTIIEVQPLLFPHGAFSLDMAWRNFTSGFFIAPIGLVLIIRTMIRNRNTDPLLLAVWSIVILAATMSQSRFAYYYAVNVALLTGYVSARLLVWSGLSRLQLRGESKPDTSDSKGSGKSRKQRKKAERRRRTIPSRQYLLPLAAAVIVFFGVFFPNSRYATEAARAAPGPSDDWHEALIWLRHETPDPFDDPGYYYQSYERPPAGESYPYPDSAYGVLSWWDYGHWITYIAHRIPNANPHQFGAADVARYLTSDDEGEANALLERLGSRYVIIDYSMTMGKFDAMALWSGEDVTRYLERYYVQEPDGEMSLITFLYPEYYETMCARLYNFGGEAVVPDNTTWVISYREEPGLQHKVMSEVEPFPTYEEALEYLDARDGPHHRLVGIDPFLSPVPLEALEHYEPVYASSSTSARVADRSIPQVQVFEYTGTGS